MNNIFKKNSRFGSLAEEASLTKDPKKNKNNKNKINEDRFKIEEDKDGENSPKNENNSFKGEGNLFKNENNSFKKSYDDRPQMNYNNGYQRNSLTNRESKESIERRALDEKKRKEENDKLEEERVAKALSVENFPALGKKENKNTNETNSSSFLAKLKNSIENDKKQTEIKIEENNKKPKPGWVTISRDPLTGKTKIEYGEQLPIKKKPEKTENEMAYDVLSALCDLHERRTKEYIDLYGYDNWEKTFKSPNWEEEEAYLERMDDEYEALMASDDDDEYEYEDENAGNDRYWERY
jgi:hypothetical protein